MTTRVGKMLDERHGYNIRERLNIYAGFVGGALAPVVAVRYAAFDAQSENLLGEMAKWAMAAAGGGIFSVPCSFIGGLIGTMSAHSNKQKRIIKEKENLERITQI